MQLTTAQNTLQQHQRHSIKRDGKPATPIVKPTTHNLWQHQNSRPLVPRLRLGTHCHRGSAASPLQTKPNQLRYRVPNRPTSTTTNPAPTYNTLRWATPHRTTTAPQPRQIPTTTTATTTTPTVTTAKLPSRSTTQAQPHIKEKPEHPAWVIYIALLRLLVATIGYIHRLRQRPQTLLRPTSTETARLHANNTPQTHRNQTLRTASKTKTYTYDGSKYNNDDIAPNYDVLNNSRRRTYKTKEQSSPTCLNDMSQYRAYFVPGATDPTGLDVSVVGVVGHQQVKVTVCDKSGKVIGVLAADYSAKNFDGNGWCSGIDCCCGDGDIILGTQARVLLSFSRGATSLSGSVTKTGCTGDEKTINFIAESIGLSLSELLTLCRGGKYVGDNYDAMGRWQYYQLCCGSCRDYAQQAAAAGKPDPTPWTPTKYLPPTDSYDRTPWGFGPKY